MAKEKRGVIVNVIGVVGERHASGYTTGCVITIDGGASHQK